MKGWRTKFHRCLVPALPQNTQTWRNARFHLRSLSIDIHQLEQLDAGVRWSRHSASARLFLWGFLAVESILRAEVVLQFRLVQTIQTDEKGNCWTPEGGPTGRNILLCRDPTLHANSNPNFAIRRQTEVKTA